uniref:MRN complex-interacting protein N-terminal domain-containing protein n=1 Tax=Hucho hucho TaxID=62062 RepID=A0A4W5LN36_9TELE
MLNISIASHECMVLKCCLCQTYQVKQVTKVFKLLLAGKLCGEKQSIIKVSQLFGRSSGVDCRHHVQKLNASELTKAPECRFENAQRLYHLAKNDRNNQG